MGFDRANGIDDLDNDEWLTIGTSLVYILESLFPMCWLES